MSKLRAFLVGAGMLMASIPAQAQTVILWADIGTDFATGSNWTSGVVPAGDVADFAAVSPSNQPVLTSNLSVDGLLFSNGAGSFTLSGTGVVAVGNSGIVNQSSSPETIAVSTSFAISASAITSTGSLTMSGAILDNASTLTVTNNGSMTISGGVANNGAQGIILGGTGLNGTISGIISGTGALRINSPSQWTLTGANTYLGTTTVAGGTLLADNATGSATGMGNVSVSAGAVLQIGNNDGDGSIGGNIANSGAIDFVRSDSLLNYGGVISGSGNVLVVGSGMVTLSGANVYTGATTVFPHSTLADGAAGSYSAASAGMFVYGLGVLDVNFNEAVANLADIGGSGGSVNLASGATLSLTGTNGSSFSGILSGQGALTVAGTGGSYVETLKGTNTYSGGTTVASGTLVLANGNATSATGLGPVTIDPSGTLKIGDGFSNAGNLAGNIADSGSVIFQNPIGVNEIYSGSISGSGGVVQAGANAVTLTGSSNYTGGTSLNNGTLIVSNGATGSATGSGDIIVNGTANLQIGGGSTPGSVQSNIVDNANVGNGVYFNTSADEAYNGVISSSGTVTQKGTGLVTLGGLNTYGGNTYLIAGTLADAAAGAFSPHSILVLGPGTLDVNFNESAPGLSDYGATNGGGTVSLASPTASLSIGNPNNSNSSFSGSISGPGSLVKFGTNTQTLAGASTYYGGTVISGGFLDVVNATGSATGTGSVTIAPGATLQVGAFGGGATGAITGNVVDNGALNFNVTVPTTYNGSISGTGRVLQLSSSKLTLGGINTYGGSTTVTGGGTLSDSVPGSLSPNSVFAVTAGAELDVNANETIAGLHVGTTGPGGIVSIVSEAQLIIDSSGFNFAGVITGPGSVEIAPGSSLQSLAGANTYSGGTIIDSGGALGLGNDAQGQNGSVVGPIVDNGTLVLNEADDSTLNNPISGPGAVVVNGDSTITISTPNTYSGGTTINAGSLLITNTTGSALGTGPVLLTGSSQSIGSGGALEGSGSVSGSVTVGAGAVILPALPNQAGTGAAPAILNFGSTTFGGGAAMAVLFNDVSGTAGSNWSLLNVNGSLTLDGTPTAPFVIGLISLDQSNQLGPVFDFNAASTYSWEIVSTTGGITGFNPNAFFITTNPGSAGSETKLAFLNSTGGGTFSVSGSGNDLFLNFTPVPEPPAWILLIGGTAAVAGILYRRRRRAA